MARQNFSSGSAFEGEYSYSRAVVIDDWIMLAGTTGYDYDKGTISSDVIEQTDQIFVNIEKALLELGSSTKDIVRVTYILVNKTDFPTLRPVLTKWLGDVRPAATMYEAPMMNEQMKVEIEATVKIGSGKDVSALLARRA